MSLTTNNAPVTTARRTPCGPTRRHAYGIGAAFSAPCDSYACKAARPKSTTPRDSVAPDASDLWGMLKQAAVTLFKIILPLTFLAWLLAPLTRAEPNASRLDTEPPPFMQSNITTLPEPKAPRTRARAKARPLPPQPKAEPPSPQPKSVRPPVPSPDEFQAMLSTDAYWLFFMIDDVPLMSPQTLAATSGIAPEQIAAFARGEPVDTASAEKLASALGQSPTMFPSYLQAHPELKHPVQRQGWPFTFQITLARPRRR